MVNTLTDIESVLGPMLELQELIQNLAGFLGQLLSHKIRLVLDKFDRVFLSGHLYILELNLMSLGYQLNSRVELLFDTDLTRQSLLQPIVLGFHESLQTLKQRFLVLTALL